MNPKSARLILTALVSIFLCIGIVVAQKANVKAPKKSVETSNNGTTWILVKGGPEGDFSIAATEVTFEQYDRFCDATEREKPEAPFGRGKQPVINVDVADAVAYCEWLSEQTGTTVRLPEESEWMFAAMGGTKSKRYDCSGSSDVNKVAWHDGNSEGRTHQVGTKKPNELGIYDMNGNVWEWCGSSGSICGGSWMSRESELFVSLRDDESPEFRDNNIGFRPLQMK